MWSTAMVRSLQPMTKYLVLSRALTTARASPSMGAYLHSAPRVNRLPINVTFQPDLQQDGAVELHEQCFCVSQKPMPDFDQSVARQVGRFFSNIRTPSSISLMMACLEASKSSSSAAVHAKVVLGLRSSRNGCMCGAEAKAYAAWFIRPHHARRSTIVLGVGKFWMDVKNSAVGRILFIVISNPAKSTSRRPKLNLCAFNITPLCPQVSSHSTAWKKLSSIVGTQWRESSMIFVLLVMWDTIASNRDVYASPVAVYP